MKIPINITIYGDTEYRDKSCPRESTEQITFVSRITNKYPDTYGRIIVHPKGEQKLINGMFSAISKDRAMASINKGASDIIIPGNPSFVCEIKRRDHTLSAISDEQISYLLAAQNSGAFVCIALGCDAAIDAFNDWLEVTKNG